MRTIVNYINGEFTESKATEFTDVINPFNEEVLAKTPHSTDSEMSNAIKVANEAFSTWSKRDEFSLINFFHSLHQTILSSFVL